MPPFVTKPLGADHLTFEGGGGGGGGGIKKKYSADGFQGEKTLECLQKETSCIKKKDLLRSGLDPRSRFSLFLIETLSITGQKFPTSL